MQDLIMPEAIRLPYGREEMFSRQLKMERLDAVFMTFNLEAREA